MIFKGWQKTSLIEYPDKVVSVFWVGGCNFRCPWCYNKDLVLNPEKLPSIKEEKILDFLKTRIGLLDGIMITGGEPTLNGGLYDFVKKVKTMGFLIGLETNGSHPELLKKLIKEKLIDFVAMDVKLPKERYSETFDKKVKIKDIEESIELLRKKKINSEFRSTVLPKVHTKEDIVNIARWIRNTKVYYLQQFKPGKTINPEYEKCRSFSPEQLEVIQKECNKYVITKLRNM